MQIKNMQESKDKQKLSFTITGVSAAYCNALRRAVISLVPTLAIEEVEIQENNSALYDEILAHRIGLIPLTTDLGSYTLPTEEEKKDGVHRAASSVKLSLEAKGPCVVLAEEFKSKDPKVKCAQPKMPVVKLLKNQTVKLEAVAVLGQGKEHYKWASGTAYYQKVPVVGSKEVTPKDLLGQKSQEVFIDNDGQINLIEAKGEIKQKEGDFIFTIESWGQLSPKEILTEATNQLNKELDALKAAL